MRRNLAAAGLRLDRGRDGIPPGRLTLFADLAGAGIAGLLQPDCRPRSVRPVTYKTRCAGRPFTLVPSRRRRGRCTTMPRMSMGTVWQQVTFFIGLL